MAARLTPRWIGWSRFATVRRIVGHNILRHDLPHLVANRARLAGLRAAPKDTLWGTSIYRRFPLFRSGLAV